MSDQAGCRVRPGCGWGVAEGVARMWPGCGCGAKDVNESALVFREDSRCEHRLDALRGGAACSLAVLPSGVGSGLIDACIGVAWHALCALTGELQEPSKKAILRVTAAQDALMEGSGDSKVRRTLLPEGTQAHSR